MPTIIRLILIASLAFTGYPAFAVTEDEYLEITKKANECAENISRLLDEIDNKEDANRLAPDIKKLSVEYSELLEEIAKTDPPSSSSVAGEYVKLRNKLILTNATIAATRARLAQARLVTPELDNALNGVSTGQPDKTAPMEKKLTGG